MKDKTYICIDLKSFYASVECIERGLDPLNTNLVVADNSRTDKTVCLAVTPSLKKYGISGRARLYEVKQKIRNVNYLRKNMLLSHKFMGSSYIDSELEEFKTYELDYIIASPQMLKYMKYSTEIYNIYLKYIAPEDIYVYSIDEVFIDITNYLKTYNMSPFELTSKMIKDVFDTTGITATAGIGTNMYLCKIAMDIVAKHKEPNEIGVRIAYLDEMSYRKLLWEHKPITDFWRVGKGITKRLEKYNIYTMGDVALCSVNNEEILYRLLGINAELLIDHAWGYEPCTIELIKSYKPSTKSICSSQVLHCSYDYKKTRLIVKEMMDLVSLDLVDKHLVTSQLVLTIFYDVENLTNPYISSKYTGEITKDAYGRDTPKHSHGTINIEYPTSSTKVLIDSIIKLYDKIINKLLLVRKVSISVNNLQSEENIKDIIKTKQFNLFSNSEEDNKEIINNRQDENDEKNIQKTLLNIQKRYGKNAILKGYNLLEGATTKDRNKQVGGHKG